MAQKYQRVQGHDLPKPTLIDNEIRACLVANGVNNRDNVQTIELEGR